MRIAFVLSLALITPALAADWRRVALGTSAPVSFDMTTVKKDGGFREVVVCSDPEDDNTCDASMLHAYRFDCAGKYAQLVEPGSQKMKTRWVPAPSGSPAAKVEEMICK
jgi:hypothetical protein